MSRLHLLTLTPSQSNKSSKSESTDDPLKTMKDRYHQLDQTIGDWSECLKALQSTSHDQTMKLAKSFTQVDTHAKRTYQALEKTSKSLDLLLDRKIDMLSTISTLTEIQTNLGLEQLAKCYWVKPHSS